MDETPLVKRNVGLTIGVVPYNADLRALRGEIRELAARRRRASASASIDDSDSSEL